MYTEKSSYCEFYDESDIISVHIASKISLWSIILWWFVLFFGAMETFMAFTHSPSRLETTNNVKWVFFLIH